MEGGKGNDEYFVDSTKDIVSEKANEGFDTVFATFSYTLGANLEQLVLDTGDDIDGTGNTLDNEHLRRIRNEQAGWRRRQRLTHDGNGDDTLIGGAGNDTLNGGEGDDAMSGGAGDDTYFVDDAGDKVTELAGQGNDTIRTERSIDLSVEGAHVENVVAGLIKNYIIIGNGLNNFLLAEEGDNTLDGKAGNDTLSSGNGKDTLTGGDGNDYLDGGAGPNMLTGGKGNDVYVLSSDADTLIELAGEGIDEVRIGVADSHSGANIENLTLTGALSIDGLGNALANVMVGNSGNNRLNGLAGNDMLSGGAGNDLVEGGLGNDAHERRHRQRHLYRRQPRRQGDRERQ